MCIACDVRLIVVAQEEAGLEARSEIGCVWGDALMPSMAKFCPGMWLRVSLHYTVVDTELAF